MKNLEAKMKSALSKRMEAMSKQALRRDEFLKAREIALTDIENAKSFWIKTMEQLPNDRFK